MDVSLLMWNYECCDIEWQNILVSLHSSMQSVPAVCSIVMKVAIKLLAHLDQLDLLRKKKYCDKETVIW